MGVEYGDTDNAATYNPDVEELIRREQDRRVVQEGTAVWRRRKEQLLRQKHHEQLQLRHLQSTYSPWGKPGGGAPYSGSLKKKNVVLEPLSPPSSQVSLQPWGRPGPGGLPWRDPRLLGVRFMESMGWTTKSFLHRLTTTNQRELTPSMEEFFDAKSRPDITDSSRRLDGVRPYTSIQNECKNTPYDYKLTGGIELVPLLTARKCHSNPIKYITTDATRPGYILDSHRSLNIENRDYTAALSEQISRKRERILEEKRLEQESCRRHFDTWRKLWGRPGHGAPIDHAYRNDLHAILYRAVPRVY
ncbi:Protein of unknown function [Cotesia congregata]|uniref:Uncharacterized protein n=1 Tax=Cotesia congregata TaxID=51543 RepID=A0A8J2EBE5_COTCN|nr:Protein of unknown function [Cotesia congregata]